MMVGDGGTEIGLMTLFCVFFYGFMRKWVW